MIFETYAWRRQKALRAGQPEIFTYDKIGAQLRHQICMAIHEGIGHFHTPGLYEHHYTANANKYWVEIDRYCLKEIFDYLDSIREKDLSQRYLNFLEPISRG